MKKALSFLKNVGLLLIGNWRKNEQLARLWESHQNLQRVVWKLEKRQQRWLYKLGIKSADLEIDPAIFAQSFEEFMGKSVPLPSDGNGGKEEKEEVKVVEEVGRERVQPVEAIGEPLPDSELVKFYFK